MKTKDIMTTPVISMTPETSVPEVARLLLGRHISAVAVLDAGGPLVGIVSGAISCVAPKNPAGGMVPGGCD